jgi:hypothetical protein
MNLSIGFPDKRFREKVAAVEQRPDRALRQPLEPALV